MNGLGFLPMDDVIGMAVVDTLQDLLHKNGSVLLRELSSWYDFIEEFSSFTYSKMTIKRLILLCHDVVSLLILEEFVHLDDIGVIL